MALPTGDSYSRPTRPDTPTGLLRTVRAQIRADIEPNHRWWQFTFRPWHYWTAITSTGLVTASVVVFLTLGGGASR